MCFWFDLFSAAGFTLYILISKHHLMPVPQVIGCLLAQPLAFLETIQHSLLLFATRRLLALCEPI